ncbi:EAL domain-containing protein [uncultured Desulfobacter sp.]|uniref:putative bifunctional diguanylate cyclase/phosphodiesterase n=1 Tax=uncultured Desulfobacter sp. TaxID=240139 RepID=UPI0029C72679|nr:EAL domain-containing protein [uncultured Desulfobacter sp.]
MMHLDTVKNLRLRYLFGLSAIALLVTASYITVHKVVSKQRDFAKLINLASHQSGLTNRIAYFSSLMASTSDESEFNLARSQVGRTIYKMKSAHYDLRNGNPNKNIPMVTNANLMIIYDDPRVGLEMALVRFLERAQQLYDSDMETLTIDSAAYIFLTTYGPHALEPLFDAAVEEYENISHAAILKIEKFELIVWLATIITLLIELVFIFRPFESQMKKTIQSLESSINQLMKFQKRLLTAQKLALVGDWELNLKTGRLTWSDQVYDICGVSQENFVVTRKSSMEVVHPEDQAIIHQALKTLRKSDEPVNMEYRIVRPDGQERVVFQHIAVLNKTENGVEKLVGTIQDITERKNSENKIKRMALYDSLTGLANRRLIKDRLAHAITTSRRNKNYGAVLMLDLDNFKSLNDTRGHNVGDALLVEVARRLLGCVRETDTVGRLGGDEFVVVLEFLGSDEAKGAQKTMQIAEKIRLALGQAYILGPEEHTHHSSTSIGITLFIDTDSNDSDVLKRADVAMYEAKDLGRNRCCFYNESRQALVNSQTEMAHALKRAIDNQEFSLYLQPQFLNNGSLCSAEALIRWLPHGGEMISPGSFIPIAENTGLIVPLGEWVLEKACQYLKNLDTYRLPFMFSISVNISARQFMDDKFIDKVMAIINRTGVDPGHLRFELTETCLVQDIDRTKVILNQLCDIGLKIELDDFGTGYSSLNSVNNFPLSALKLDRSLISGIEKKKSKKAIVKAALAMAKAMGMSTIAEGVETKGQIEFLIKEGCDMFQGFYYARPMPFEEFTAYLSKDYLQADIPPENAKVVHLESLG